MGTIRMRVIAVGLAAVLVAACGGSDGDESEDETPSTQDEASDSSDDEGTTTEPPSEEALDPTTIDPCALVTAAQAREAIGEPGLSEGEVSEIMRGRQCYRSSSARAANVAVLDVEDPEKTWKTTQLPSCTAEDLEFEEVEASLQSCEGGTVNLLFTTRGVVVGVGATDTADPDLARLETEARALGELALASVQAL